MTVSRLTIPTPSPAATSKQEIASLLTEARERTLLLISSLSDEDLHQQHDPLMSPIIWDVGHIAHFEELWLTRNLDGPIEFSEMPGLYNPFEHPRATRATLALPTLAEMIERLNEIRARVLDRLELIELDDRKPLLRDGYVYNMCSSTSTSTTRRFSRHCSSRKATRITRRAPATSALRHHLPARW